MKLDFQHITQPEALNFINPYGLGDLWYFNVYRKAIEEKYKLPLHFVIKPSHKIVMDMFGNTHYSIHEFSRDELYDIAAGNDLPRKGRLYVAHPIFSDISGLMEEWLAKAYPVQFLWKRFFGLDKNTPEGIHVWYPDIPDNTGLSNPSETVLLLPDANSVRPLHPAYWKKIVKDVQDVQKEGFKIVQNSINPVTRIRGIPLLPDNIYLVTAFAAKCRKVYSLRSGLCDLIAGKVKDLTVFYPTEFAYKVYCLEKKFSEQRLENLFVKTRERKSVKEYMERPVKNLKKYIKRLFQKLKFWNSL